MRARSVNREMLQKTDASLLAVQVIDFLGESIGHFD
jgi:hypothetical protein